MAKRQAPYRPLGRTRNKKLTVDDKEQEKCCQDPNVLTPQECESLQLALENANRSPQDKQIVEEEEMAKRQAPYRLLGRIRNKKLAVDDKEQGKRRQGGNVLTPQECESLQLALENGNRSPQDKQILEEQMSRFWGTTDGPFLCLSALSRECTADITTRPYSTFIMYFRDGIPSVNFEEERDNMSLLLGSLRGDHDMTEEGWQAFEDRMSLLNESSFGGGPIIGYDMDTLRPDDLGDDNDENSISEHSSILTSPDQSVTYSITRPTDSVVVAVLLQQEALQPNSPRCENILALDIYRMKRLRDKLLSQKNAALQLRAEAKRTKRDLQKKDFQHHMVSNGLGTVVELSFEDERTIVGSVKKSRSRSMSRSRLPTKPRPRPPPIRTLILDCEVYQQQNEDGKSPECETTSWTACTGSSGDPIEEPRPPAIKALILYYEGRRSGKDDRPSATCRRRSVSTVSSDPILEEADLMNQ
jgi:hypothetical protein